MTGMLSFIARIGFFVIAVLSLAVAGTATFIIFSSLNTLEPVTVGMPSSHAPTISGSGPTPAAAGTPGLTGDSHQVSTPTVFPCPMPASPPPLSTPLPAGVYREARSVLEADDGGSIVTGGTMTGTSGGSNWDFYVAKTDRNGNELWARTYGGTQYDYAWDILPAYDEGYIIVGSSESYGSGSRGVCLFKINAAGDLLWLNTYGDSGNGERYALRKTGDGCYIILAVSPQGNNEKQVVIADSNGQLLWSRANGKNSSKAGDPGPAAGRGQSHNK